MYKTKTKNKAKNIRTNYAIVTLKSDNNMGRNIVVSEK